MARPRKKSLDERINEKEDLISNLLIRIKTEQKELEALYNEKKISELEIIQGLIEKSGLSISEAQKALNSYSVLKQENAS